MKKIIGFLLGLCIAAFSFAGDAPKVCSTKAPAKSLLELKAGLVLPADNENGAVLAESHSAITLPSGELGILVYAGPQTTNSIRIYSEPSHTRIATVVDLDYAETAAGKAWLVSISDEKRLGENIFARLAGSSTVFSVHSRPLTDDRTATFVNGSFFGYEADLLVSIQLVGNEKGFGGSTYIKPLTREELDAEIADTREYLAAADRFTDGATKRLLSEKQVTQPLYYHCCDPNTCCGCHVCVENCYSKVDWNCCTDSDTCATQIYCPAQRCARSRTGAPSGPQQK